MNKINSILKGSVIALCIVGTIVLLKALFSGAEFGSVSDWVNSVCNVAIASAAVYAAMQAKRWFDNLSYTAAFNKAADFLSKIDTEIDQINSSRGKTYDLQEYVLAVNNGTIKFADSVIRDYEKLCEYNLAKCNGMDQFTQEYKNLKRWPILQHQNNSIDELIKAISSVYFSRTAAYDLAKHFLLSSQGGPAMNTTIYFHEFKNSLIQLQHSKGKLDDLYKEFNNNSFSDYFTAK